MRGCCWRVRGDRPSFAGDENVPRAEALERFDRLRIREVRAVDDRTASTFLAKFQSTAANLEPDERIKLLVSTHESGVELLKAVLSDPQANKICALLWIYDGNEDANSIVPLLTNSCPEMVSLRVEFGNHSAFDFVSSVLERSSNKIKVLEMPKYAKGDIPRFFAALGQSQVSALTLFSAGPPGFTQGFYKYLARDLLVRLKVWMNRVPSAMLMSLTQCTRLVEFKLTGCEFSQPTAFTHLPKFITKLTLDDCTFFGGFDWSFLSDSNVQELNLYSMRGVDGNHFGGALAVHLRTKGLDKLYLWNCGFVKETLAAVGIELGRIKRLDLSYSTLDNASLELIALVLQSPDSELRELKLEYTSSMMSSIENHLVPALKHPNCNLAKLSLSTYGGQVKAVEDVFRNRLALFVLLQGQQVRRRYCPLRRLPVEMFKLVGMGLL